MNIIKIQDNYSIGILNLQDKMLKYNVMMLSLYKSLAVDVQLKDHSELFGSFSAKYHTR